MPLVFPLVDPFEDGEPGFFRVCDRKRFQLNGGAEIGEDLAHGLLAGRAIRERLGGKWPSKGELPAAHRAAALG